MAATLAFVLISICHLLSVGRANLVNNTELQNLIYHKFSIDYGDGNLIQRVQNLSHQNNTNSTDVGPMLDINQIFHQFTRKFEALKQFYENIKQIFESELKYLLIYFCSNLDGNLKQ